MAFTPSLHTPLQVRPSVIIPWPWMQIHRFFQGEKGYDVGAKRTARPCPRHRAVAKHARRARWVWKINVRGERGEEGRYVFLPTHKAFAHTSGCEGHEHRHIQLARRRRSASAVPAPEASSLPPPPPLPPPASPTPPPVL